MEYLINYVKNEDFTNTNQFYVIAIYILYEKFLDHDNFITKLKESSHLPITIIIFTLGDEDFDLEHVQSIYKEQKEDIIRKNILIIKFNEIFKKIESSKLSIEVILRPIENSIFKEISSQVKCYYC